MFETILSAIRCAKLKLAEKNIRGDIIIELEQREWSHFKYDLRVDLLGAVPFEAETALIEGATVRLKRT